MATFGLHSHELEKIRSVFKRFSSIDEVIIYGSRAMETENNYSDVDLTLKGSLINSDEITKLEMELDYLNLPYTFDLSEYSKIDNTSLIDHIDRVGKVFYIKS